MRRIIRDRRPPTGRMPVQLTTIIIPVLTLVWFINIMYFFLSPTSKDRIARLPIILPWRWYAAVSIPLLLSVWGLKRRSVDITGALSGFLIGFILTLTNLAHSACLIAFFVSSAKATRFRMEEKKKIDSDFKEGGQRDWIYILCNGGMAAHLGLLYFVDVGCGERPIDFVNFYRSSWLSMAILGVLSSSNGDTWAYEFGSVTGSSDPFLITTKKYVPRGTNGGISWLGLLFSLLGGLFVGFLNYLTVIRTVDAELLSTAEPQWPIIIMGGIGGLLGSIIDSILGATLQYSGVDERGHIVERPRRGLRYISGRIILDNHSVNLITTIAMALIIPRIAQFMWI